MQEGQAGQAQTPSSSDKQPGVSPPSISLPKGGGAIRGVGEKFAANPVTGTGSMSVPIAVSPGRTGFGPQLSLAYDSGSGNGPFGLGWTLSLPSITRKTEKGLPRYRDVDEPDTFVLSDAEDLMPVLKRQGDDWVPEDVPDLTIGVDIYRIRRYRPRIEGLFARIERWTNTRTNESHWLSISKENITTVYGRTSRSRIEDPNAPRLSPRVFEWLICESYDDKGNAIHYEYEKEDSRQLDLSIIHERNRTDADRSANRYLKRIRYGNRAPVERDPDLPREFGETLSERTDWLFEVVFDYEDGHYEELPAGVGGDRFANARPDPTRAWQKRQDPFSNYRSGFEVRTYRLCRRVLMFHHFPEELGADDCLVRSTEFEYREGPIASFIVSVTQSGFRRRDDGSYLKKSLPPLEFEYSEAIIQEELHGVDAESLENLPQGLDGAKYQWVDLDGEGASGILTEEGHTWFYKRNVSALPVVGEDGKPRVVARFAPAERLNTIPSFNDLSADRLQLLDLAGDGQLDVVRFDGPTPGFFERTREETWNPFRPFPSLPNISWQDPNLKLVDLNGDGHADIFITGDDAFDWYPSLAEQGFAPAERVAQAPDEEKGPKLVFADGTQSIYLADMSGDGLTDLVRIRNGEVCYWPNLGYGRFGAKVTMDGSPHFDTPDHFDQRRIRLADIDGSGVTDILYLKGDGVDIYFNESGNGWAAARRLDSFPRIDDLSSVMVLDLLGDGTACLVWSSPLPAAGRRPLCYIDLMGGQKPHLLTRVINNLGAETLIHYAPSTMFHLADEKAGRPWITRIPFPVHVVERVENCDCISRNRFVTRYAYHHGYFDGIEREFRGFGMVEQWDTEEYAVLAGIESFPAGDNLDASSHVPPVLTRTWFHHGAYVEGRHISDFYAGLADAEGTRDAGEYYREPGLTGEMARALLLEDTILPAGLTAEEEREACRALKGAMLRQEVYALDGTEREAHPYSVVEQNFTIHVLQARGGNRNAVFFTHAREAITYHYERNPADPRVAHSLTLEVDDFGNVLKTAAVGYGRRQPDPNLPAADQAKQTQLFITYTENGVTNLIDAAGDYRTPLPCEIRSYELTGYTPTGAAGRFQISDFVRPDLSNPAGQKRLHLFDGEVGYEDSPFGDRQRRLIECVRMLYRPDDLGVSLNDTMALLPLGAVEALALPGETYKLAFTPGLLARVYQRPRDGQPPESLLPDPAVVLGGEGPDRGGYVDLDGDGHWWIPSGRIFHSPETGDTALQELAHSRRHFFQPCRYRDPFGQTSVVINDAYDLLMLETRDSVGNRVTAGERDADGNVTAHGNDYRVLQPREIMDVNRNRSAVAFDTLGMVVATAVMGKPEENRGDSLEGIEADLAEAAILDHLADPHAILGRATTRLVYDLFAYLRTKGLPDPQPATVYTMARETHDADLEPGQQTKVQHSFRYSDGFGREIQKKIQAEPGPLVEGGVEINPRWVGSGWTVFNNKGKPVRQYEPFFTETHRFEFDIRIGVSPVLFYDPVGRTVATLHPNQTWEKVVFDPWRRETWDVNDTVLIEDPKDDPDVADYFSRLPAADYLPVWYRARVDGARGVEEQAAARKTELHAETPAMAYMDSLGRAFLAVAHNRFDRKTSDGSIETIEERHETRSVNDIEGNLREVIDALDRVVMRCDYGMLGNAIHSASMEAGERWMLNDVAGKPIRAWDSRDHQFRTVYDRLRRPLESYLREDTGPELLVGRTIYGETLPNPENDNLRGKVVRSFDQAGVVMNEGYDFKGNPLGGGRQLAAECRQAVDWSHEVALETEVFRASTTFDALNRPRTLTKPDHSVIRLIYNEANLLEAVEGNLRGAVTAAVFVRDIDYNAKGQRVRIEYGNGTLTSYEYDPLTFRLTHLRTLRGAERLQDLFYTYDPAGNITQIRDDAQQTIYFNNVIVEPYADYTYDAIYRLIRATGREHIGQVSQPQTTWDDEFRVNLPHPNDGQAMRNYTEVYEYDSVGNILRMIHRAINDDSGNWTRGYAYSEPSLIEHSKINNRLTSTTVGSTTEPYTYDAHGNMTSMSHLPLMRWNHLDQLAATSRQVVSRGTPETTWYVYDAAGQRVRKVTERRAEDGAVPARMKERIYLGGFEVYREYGGSGATIDLERETLHVVDGQQRIALVETRTEGDDESPEQIVRYQLGNHLGSASLELDETGQIISCEEYYPYGSTSYQAVDASIKAAAKRYRYTGKERDEESGLYYHGARYYASWLGRWCSVDPQRDNHPYSYSLDSPQIFVDRDGRVPTLPDSTLSSIQAWAADKLDNAASNLGTIAQFASDMSLVPSIVEMTVKSPLDLVPSQAFQEGRPLGRDLATVAGAVEAGIGIGTGLAGAAILGTGIGGGATAGTVVGPEGSIGGGIFGGLVAAPAAGTLIIIGGGMALHGGAVLGANYMNGRIDPKDMDASNTGEAKRTGGEPATSTKSPAPPVEKDRLAWKPAQPARSNTTEVSNTYSMNSTGVQRHIKPSKLPLSEAEASARTRARQAQAALGDYLEELGLPRDQIPRVAPDDMARTLIDRVRVERQEVVRLRRNSLRERNIQRYP